jgi:hypothetical protein
MQYFGWVCKFQDGTSPPFAPNSLKVKTERGATIHNVMFFIQSWTIFIVIGIGYTYMPIFTLGCWCQLRFGQEWTHCLKNIAHFAKRAGTIRVQEDSRYIPKGSLHSDYASYTSSCIAATLGTSKLARVNHHLPVHYPLDACYDSVVNEPQPSYIGFHFANPFCKKWVIHLGR